MSKKIGIPVESGDPFVNFFTKNPSKIIKKNAIPFTTAIGLALIEVDDNK